jgi:long-chain acyl-CoA synthetase
MTRADSRRTGGPTGRHDESAHPAEGHFDRSGIDRGADGVLRYRSRPSSLVEMLHDSVERDPDAEALVEPDGPRLSYRQLWEGAGRVAGGLRREGVRPGDRVAIELGNGVDWALAFFGAQLAAAIAVPVNTRLAASERDYVLDDAEVAYRVRPGDALPDGPAHVVEDLEPDDVATIFYTSGTTGFPKGAATTHENLLATTESSRRIRRLPRGETRDLISVPLFHATGCHSQLLTSVDLGGTAVIMPRFEVQRFLRAIAEERVNKTTSVPAIYWLALNQDNLGDFDLSSVRWLSYGGAPCPPRLVRRIVEAFPQAEVGNGFGLTECASVATFLPSDFTVSHAETVGLPVPVDELDLADPDPASGVGELLIRGQNVVAGYWRNPEATAATFVDGWLHTGDLARIDEHGFCEIVDRKKDMVNRGGENVYCLEVENVLVNHPAVFEVAVVGVEDEMMGEKVGAVVVPHPGAELEPGELTSFAADHLADFKVPEYVAVRNESLPRNPGGKILKPSLREQADWHGPLRRPRRT